MPEFEDNSILGESLYHAVQFGGSGGRGGGGGGDEGEGRVNMQMFEKDPGNAIECEDRGGQGYCINTVVVYF